MFCSIVLIQIMATIITCSNVLTFILDWNVLASSCFSSKVSVRLHQKLFMRFLLANLGSIATKPVFGVSDKVSFRPVSSATETM